MGCADCRAADGSKTLNRCRCHSRERAPARRLARALEIADGRPTDGRKLFSQPVSLGSCRTDPLASVPHHGVEPGREPVGALSPPVVADFRIVPPVGLVLAGVVLAGLVVVVATDAVWPLDFMHIVFGSAWTGVDLFVGLVVGLIVAGGIYLSAHLRRDDRVRVRPQPRHRRRAGRAEPRMAPAAPGVRAPQSRPRARGGVHTSWCNCHKMVEGRGQRPRPSTERG